MRIALVTPEFEPDTFGGGAIVFSELARELGALGHDVTIVTQRIRQRTIPQPGLVRVGSARAPMPALVGSVPPWPWHLPAIRKALAAAEVVNVHGYGWPFTAVASLLTSKPSVLTLHGFPVSPGRLGGAAGLVYGAYDRLVARRSLRATKLTAVSSSVVRDAAAFTSREIAVVSNGVRVVEPTNEPAPPHEPYLLCIGRTEWYKAFDIAIDALAIPPLRDSPLGLTIVGRDGGLHASLRERAERAGVGHRVHFAGERSRAEIFDDLRGARALVVPSTTESFSLVALEAMSVRCPVLTTAVGGMRDFCTDGSNALVFPVGDAARLAELAGTIERDPILRQRLIENGSVTASAYAWPAIANRYVEIYESALRSPQLRYPLRAR